MNINMGIIKVVINVPEAIKAIEDFRKNRIRAFETLTSELKASVGDAVNALLHTEMTLFLGKPDQSDNKRNDYKEKDLALKGVGCIRLKMPQDRKRRFQSSIIKPNEQIDPRLKEDMAVLHLAGLSTRTMAMVSKRILGIEVSTSTVSESLGLIEEKALNFLTRPLEKAYWGLYIDGTNFRIQRHRIKRSKISKLGRLGKNEAGC
jgi:transposase-like protein